MKRNPNQPKTHTNPAQNPASSPARPALSSGPKPQPKIQPSPKTPARSNHCAAQPTSSPRRPAWPSHAARSLSPLLPLTSWLSQATPRAPISLGPPASAPARPRGPAATARQRHVSLSCVTRALRPRPTGPTCRRRSSRRPRPRQAHLSVAPSDAPAPRPAYLPASLAHAPQTSRAHCPSAADSPAPMSGPSLPTRPRQSRPKSPAVILAAPFPGHARQIPPAYPFIAPRGPPVSHPHASTAVNLAPPPAGTLCSVAAATPPRTCHLEGQLRPLRITGAPRGGGGRLQPLSPPLLQAPLGNCSPEHQRAATPRRIHRCEPSAPFSSTA